MRGETGENEARAIGAANLSIQHFEEAPEAERLDLVFE
jgi:hypothetical protein